MRSKHLRLGLGILALATLTIGSLESSHAGFYFQGPFKINLADEGAKRKDAKLFLPNQYDPTQSKRWPLVVLLHGFRINGTLQDLYFGLKYKVSSREFALLVPEGTPNSKREQFWNATDACCNFEDSPVDDVGYLVNLIRKTQEEYSIDPQRVYIVGHSNGGFMAHRLACEASDLLAGIVSLAGAMNKDPMKCNPQNPVSVLQIHAEDDPVIHYQGGTMTEGIYPYPTALETIDQWLTHNRCEATFEERGPFRFVRTIPGDDTLVRTWTHCQNRTEVSLWTLKPYSSIFHSPHGPWFKDEVTERILDFLMAHTKAH